MKKDLKRIFENAKQVSLTERERDSILKNIIGEAEDVRNISTWRLYDTGGIATLANRYQRISLMRYSIMLTSFAIIVALLETTNTYAQMSLPGELLYPVKIDISEKLEHFTAMTPKAQAILEATFAARRLEEAAVLLSSHELTRSRSTELASVYSGYTGALLEHLSELRQSGDKEDANNINSLFEASVQNHKEILNVFQASSSINKNLSDKSNGISAETRSSTTKNYDMDDEPAPFVTTPNGSDQVNDTQDNIKTTNTVEVPSFLNDNARVNQ